MSKTGSQASQTVNATPPKSGVLQRKCACGQHSIAGSECTECSKNTLPLQRATRGSETRTSGGVPAVVHDVLHSSGQPLDAATRAYMEPRFGHDFSRVRVHTDAPAARSAHAVNALAYTVGQKVVFGEGQYAPDTTAGQRMLAHELTHVVQQSAHRTESAGDVSISAGGALESEAEQVSAEIVRGGLTSQSGVNLRASRPQLNRADPAAVARVVGRGAVVGSGIQFFPTNVVDTQVGPVSGQGGLIGDQANRLSVIIGENLTLRGLARQLMPLWSTATPFTPPGGGAPVPNAIITEDQLARGLLVFNQFYLPVPAMTQWRAGLRFPLPVEIDELTGMATVHPTLIQDLATAFNAAWTPLLDLAATATVAPAPADLNRQAADFLAAEPSVIGRGISLGARALTNALAERPFIAEVFRQVGPGAFDVALAFMDELVNHQIDLLASQRDGAAILAQIDAALAARPAVLSATQQASFDRATLMLGRRAAIAPRNPPGRACEPGNVRSVTVQPVFFRNNAADPAPTGGSFAGRMQVARDIWAKLGVNFTVNAPIMRDDAAHKTTGSTVAELGAIAGLRTAAGVEVFVVDNDIAILGGAATFMSAPGPASKTILSDRGTSDTLLAHEIGHDLGLFHPGDGTAHDGDANTIMQPTGSHSVANSTRNTALNSQRITWPAGAATCIRPDP
jgi:Domain of unknown function (DUF4157)